MKKTFCNDTPRVPSTQGPLLTALWSADKDNVDDKWNISRTKEIPCFIVQRKPPSTRESKVWGTCRRAGEAETNQGCSEIRELPSSS